MRDRQKFDHMVDFANSLPRLRRRVLTVLRSGDEVDASGCSPARYGCWISACSGISDYLKSLIGSQHTAKDFRTWNATVMAAVSLAADGRDATTKTARKRAMDGAVLDLLHDDRGSPAVEHSLPRAA